MAETIEGTAERVENEGKEADDGRAESFASLEAEAMGGQGAGGIGGASEGGRIDIIPTEVLLLPVVSLVCDKAAPLWGITDAEKQGLSKAYADVLDFYFPGLTEMGPVGGALLMTMAVFAPRMGMPRKPEEEKEKGKGDAD